MTTPRWQRLKARRAGISTPQTGAVTLCQRFGSILQFTPHFHSWLPDGVWSDDGQGGLQFHRLPPPSDQQVDTLLYAVAAKVDRLLSTTDDDDDAAADDDTVVMRDAQQRAVQSPLPTVRRPWATAEIRPRKPRCAVFEGYSLHADLAVGHEDRKKLERLLRYGLRPPFAQKRLSLTSDGKVRLKLRKPYTTGQTEIVLPPKDFFASADCNDSPQGHECRPLPRCLRAPRDGSASTSGLVAQTAAAQA